MNWTKFKNFAIFFYLRKSYTRRNVSIDGMFNGQGFKEMSLLHLKRHLYLQWLFPIGIRCRNGIVLSFNDAKYIWCRINCILLNELKLSRHFDIMQSLLAYVQTLIQLPFQYFKNRNQVLTSKLISCQHYSYYFNPE